jgi:hypothetical protein
MADTLALRERFIKEFGQPRWTIIHGQSMGGHVAIASLELHPEIYQGGLIECGVLDGVGLVDWLDAYTAAADYLSGVRLLDTPRPGFDGLVNGTWIGLMGMPGDYPARGRRFDSVVKHMAGGDLPLRLKGLKARYLLNLNSRDPGPLRAQEFARHADTRHIRYAIDPGLGLDDETLNREIRRVTPAPGARSRETNPVFAELTGKIRVPVMTIHETADLRVPFRLQQGYRRRTLAAGTGHLLVQRAVRWAGHGAFDGVVRERAVGDLIAWMERGVVEWCRRATTSSATSASSVCAGRPRCTRTTRRAALDGGAHRPSYVEWRPHSHVETRQRAEAPPKLLKLKLSEFWPGALRFRYERISGNGRRARRRRVDLSRRHIRLLLENNFETHGLANECGLDRVDRRNTDPRPGHRGPAAVGRERQRREGRAKRETRKTEERERR